MKLAFSTNAYTNYTLAESIAAIANLGYSGVEILCDTPHWYPGRVSPREVNKISCLLKQAGLSISNLNVNTANCYSSSSATQNTFEPSLSNANKELREWRLNYTIDAIRLADSIGAKTISVTSGLPQAGYERHQSLGFFVDSLKTICAEGSKFGVNVGIEYEPGLLVERASDALEIIKSVDSDCLGVNFDIGHSYLVNENPTETVNLLAGRVWNVHIEDIKKQKHFHLVPGDGDVPLKEYLQSLKRTGYEKYLTVELYTYPHKPNEVGRRALDYLQNLVKQLQ